MDFISKLSKPLRNVQSFAIKHWKYIFVMFVLIAYIIHALFRKEGMMEYMDTSESGSTENDYTKFAEAATDVVEKHNERLADMEEKFKTLAMSSGDGELMDDLNGQAGSVEATPPPPTNVMQANSSASAAEKAAAEKAAKEAAAKAAAAKLEVLKQDIADKKQSLDNSNSKKNRKDKRKN